MVTAANPCTLAECEENVTQLQAILNQEDLGILPQQVGGKGLAKVCMAMKGRNGMGTGMTLIQDPKAMLGLWENQTNEVLLPAPFLVPAEAQTQLE